MGLPAFDAVHGMACRSTGWLTDCMVWGLTSTGINASPLNISIFLFLLVIVIFKWAYNCNKGGRDVMGSIILLKSFVL